LNIQKHTKQSIYISYISCNLFEHFFLISNFKKLGKTLQKYRICCTKG